MTALRPIGHEDRLSLVEHLDELRTRLIFCLVGLRRRVRASATGRTTLLDIVNRPLEQTQNLDGKDDEQGPARADGALPDRVGPVPPGRGRRR